MDGYRPGLAVLVGACAFIALTPVSAHAQSPGEVAAALGNSHLVSDASPLHRATVHRKRVSSFYCYPRKYWWFYRPYTTDTQNYARCMPYFHYLGPGYGRGVKGGGYPK